MILIILSINVQAQVSPVSNLNQQNSPIVNQNFNYLQNGVNVVAGLFATYFSGGYLKTSAGGTGTDSSHWASGDTVVMSNTGIWGHTSSNPHGFQLFTSSGTFTAPAGITTVYLKMVGGGGAGSGNNFDSNNKGGGGASGAFVIDHIYSVTPLSSYTVTIGAGGAIGGTSNHGKGSDGGTTTFDTFSVSGGTAGGATVNGSALAGVAVGGLDGYDGSLQGKSFLAGAGATGANNIQSGGGGGNSFARGGAGGFAGVGEDGTYGSGGGGGGANGVIASGGKGGNGFILVVY